MFIFNLLLIGFSSFFHSIVLVFGMFSFCKTDLFSITEPLRRRWKDETKSNVKKIWGRIYYTWNLTCSYFRNFIRNMLPHKNSTVIKLSKYGVFSGPYFPAFGVNTERYGVSLCIQSESRKIQTRKSSVFRHFSRSDYSKMISTYWTYLSESSRSHSRRPDKISEPTRKPQWKAIQHIQRYQ